MAFKKGDKRPEKSGRKAGSSNKVTGDIRQMLRESLTAVGGIDYLNRQAKENPTSYMTLIGKIIPAEIHAKLSGKATLIIKPSGE